MTKEDKLVAEILRQQRSNEIIDRWVIIGMCILSFVFAVYAIKWILN